MNLKSTAIFKQHPLLFLHLPKCAGTSLRVLLDDQFPADKVCKVFNGAFLREKHGYDLQAYEVYLGHLDAKAAAYIPHKPIFITLLRDPVERILSGYDYWRTRNAIPPLRLAVIEEKARVMDFKSFLKDPEIQIDLKNCQANYLAGNYYEHDHAEDAALLDLALENLRACAWVGILEHLPLSMDLLADTFAWQPVDLPARNVTSRREKDRVLDEETRDLLRELTALDQPLYEEGKRLFAMHASRMFESHGIQMTDWIKPTDYLQGRARVTKALRDQAQNRETSEMPSPSETRVYDFSERLFGMGWQDREFHEKTRSFVRWTGALAHLEFPLEKAQDTDFALQISGCVEPEQFDGLEVFANGEPLAISKKSGARKLTVTGRIPAAHIKRDNLRLKITLRVSKLCSPGRETRKLGVRVSSLSWWPSRHGWIETWFGGLKVPQAKRFRETKVVTERSVSWVLYERD